MTARNMTIAAGTAIVAALLLLPAIGPGAFSSLGARMTGQQELPPGVTAEKIAMGKELFQTQGCVACHGADAKGKPGMTGSLTDSEWKFAEGGAFPALVKVTTEGLTPAQTGAMPMPNSAGKKLSVEQVEALAAYSWSLSR
ncbi:MAG: cytochrome c [Longimicrobiales bacterium]|nr:cytochrome c [Longimicrobiales bacterium]